MNILVATNKNYLLPTLTMLYSLLSHTKEEVVVYVLHSELKEKEKEKIDNILSESGHSRAEYILISEKEFEEYPTKEWISKETYYRLLAQKLLPESVDRILWLDGDTIILDDLSELYHMDLKGKLIAACDLGLEPENNREYALKRRLLPMDARPFNAGVILFDMSAIRKQIDPEIYMQYVQFLGNHLFFADQDVLNAVFYNLVCYIDPIEYNYIRVLEPIDRLRKIVDFSKVKVIHYNGIFKPWSREYYGLYAHIFWKYAKHISGWNMDYEELRKTQKNSRRRLLRKMKKRMDKNK